MALAAVLAAAAACGGGGDSGGGDDAAAPPSSAAGAVTTAPGPSTAPSTTAAAAATLTLRVTDVRLINSEESDSGLRILLPGGTASATVTLTGLPSPNRVVSVCQADSLDRRMGTAVCRMPGNGEAVTLPLGPAASGVEIVQAGTSSAGPGGNVTALDDISIRYSASSRELSVRLPQIASGDSGGRPTFALTPAGTTGAYRGVLTWTVIQVFGGTPSNAQLEVVQSGAVANQAQSNAADVRLNGSVSPGADAAIRVANTGTSALITPKLSLLLP